MKFKIPDQLIDQVSVVEHDDYHIKQLAEELDVSEGWDDIPEDCAGSSIICYRGPHIYYFQTKKPEFPGQSGVYQMVQFKDYEKHEGLEDVAWDLADMQGAVPRVAGALFHLN